jgi:hypothetical protein
MKVGRDRTDDDLAHSAAPFFTVKCVASRAGPAQRSLAGRAYPQYSFCNFNRQFTHRAA